MHRQIDPWDSPDHARRPAVEWSGCGKRGRNTPTGNFSWETHSARQTRPVLRRPPAPSHDCDAQSTTASEPGKRARRGRRESRRVVRVFDILDPGKCAAWTKESRCRRTKSGTNRKRPPQVV